MKQFRGGTTLVEILVATTILSFAIAPIVAMFAFASRSMGSSVHRVQAQFLAHAVIESLKAEAHRDPEALFFLAGQFEMSPVREFGGLWSVSGISLFNNVHGPDRPITSDSPLYEQFRQFRINVSTSGNRSMRFINVTVSWETEGKKQNLKLISSAESTPAKFVRYEHF